MSEKGGPETTARTPSEMPVAIVIGLDCIAGLQTARLLAARGVPVVGIASNSSHFCARTRVCQEVIQATTSSVGLIEALVELRSRLGARPILFPCTDASVLLLSSERGRLGDFRFALPAHDVVKMLLEKPAMTRHAQDQGFRIPASFEVRDRHDLDVALASLRFPCVLKPAIKDARWISHTPSKAFEARDEDALVQIFDTCSGWSDRFIVQEWIEGPESELYSCNCYFSQEGEVLADFVARKIRQWPPGTGTSALGIECRSDEVREETLRLFRGVGYVGLGYVEMKRDQRSGEFFLIEPNVGRPTGRSAIAEAGGVELLYSMYCDLAGLPLPTQRTQTYGQAKWIYLRHDLQAAYCAWRRGELTIRDWWTSVRGPKSFAVLSLRDPLPFLYDLVGAASKAMTRLRAKPHRPEPGVSPVSSQQPNTTP